MKSSSLCLALLVGFSALVVLDEPIEAQVLSSRGKSIDLASVRPVDRITGAIDESLRVVRTGNVHPLARPESDRGPAAADTPMNRMVLLLEPSATQQEALEALLEAQQDPKSPEYHQWLSPEDFGRMFGASDRDVERVTAWLESHGFQVEPVANARRQIVFSGNAAQVQSAFQTEIHVYNAGGELHYANATDPEIPQALAEVVGGVVSLHNFQSQPMHGEFRPAAAPAPEYTSGANHYLAPADFATIYDSAGLYTQSIDGTGQSVAVVARSDYNASDVQMFRNQFALPANNPTVIVNGKDPGIVSTDEQGEATLDVEWAGAVARKASIQFVVSASTNTSDGVDLSAQYIVNHNVAPVVTLSFGLCEADLGSAGNQFWNSLWQQAASQGMTVFVAAGDNGAAGCASPSAASATGGKAVNGLCSSPYSTCVGGTQFKDTSNPSAYWSANSNPTSFGSALSYIPEAVWNESGNVAGGTGLWAGGGGASQVYVKPSWQTGPGVPADGQRDVPDVALTSAVHDGYLVAMDGEFYIFGGTSAATPSFAGLMALVNQKTQARQGSANPALYALAGNQFNGGAAIFHDVTSGSNSVPGQTGFTAGTGYDAASGWGSVDASVLVNHWTDANVPAPVKCTYSLGATGLSATAAGGSLSDTVTTQSGCAWSAASNASWMSLTSGSAGSGNGKVAVTVAANNSPTVRTGTLTIGGQTVTVTQAAYAFSLNPMSVTVARAGGTGSVAITASSSTAAWSAVSNSTWITITSATSGKGSTTVTYKVAANTGAARTGTLTIAGLTFTVNQNGLAAEAACTYQVSLGAITTTASGYSGTVSVNTSAGCQWAASSNASWLSVTSGSSGSGKGTASFLAGLNTTKSARTGVLTVAGYAIDFSEPGH